jgi:predicted transposase YdaD
VASTNPEASGTGLAAEIDEVIAAIQLSRFSGCFVPEICAMGGITVDDFTSSVAYREIFGLGHQQGEKKGEQKGEQKGPQAEAAAISLRLLGHRFGALTPSQQARIQDLPLSALETLSVALLDFQGPEDLNTWLSRHAS